MAQKETLLPIEVMVAKQQAEINQKLEKHDKKQGELIKEKNNWRGLNKTDIRK